MYVNIHMSPSVFIYQVWVIINSFDVQFSLVKKLDTFDTQTLRTHALPLELHPT